MDNSFYSINCVAKNYCKFAGYCLHFSFFLRFYFIFSERGREGERGRETSVCGCFSCMPSTGGLARNAGMCPNWELNQRPFDLRASTQSTKPHQPGLIFLINVHLCLMPIFAIENYLFYFYRFINVLYILGIIIIVHNDYKMSTSLSYNFYDLQKYPIAF